MVGANVGPWGAGKPVRGGALGNGWAHEQVRRWVGGLPAVHGVRAQEDSPQLASCPRRGSAQLVRTLNENIPSTSWWKGRSLE